MPLRPHEHPSMNLDFCFIPNLYKAWDDCEYKFKPQRYKTSRRTYDLRLGKDFLLNNTINANQKKTMN